MGIFLDESDFKLSCIILKLLYVDVPMSTVPSIWISEYFYMST